jgi:hypothetical protein
VNEFFNLSNPSGRTRPGGGGGGHPASNRNEYQKQKYNVSGNKAWPVHSTDNLTAICEPIV